MTRSQDLRHINVIVTKYEKQTSPNKHSWHENVLGRDYLDWRGWIYLL